MKVQRLSLAFRRNYWTRNADEQDAGNLWAGFRPELSRWLSGETSIVIGALTTPAPSIVASRSVFTRSIVDHEHWFYGYFYTHPTFRRQGLGESVMRAGLMEIAKLGGRCCSCYVAENNSASIDLAIKLGFRQLPFIRVVFRGGHDSERDCRNVLAEAKDAHLSSDINELVNAMIGDWGANAIVKEELLVRKPWQPWRRADSHLVKVYNEGICLGVGRVGPNRGILLPDLKAINNDPTGLILAAVAAIRRDVKQSVFAFLPLKTIDTFREIKNKVQFDIYYVFFHDNFSLT